MTESRLTSMKKKVGRPNSGRSEYLEVRLTPEEKQRFEAAAEDTGLSLSDWVRFNLRACSAPTNDPRAGTFSMKGKTE